MDKRLSVLRGVIIALLAVVVLASAMLTIPPAVFYIVIIGLIGLWAVTFVREGVFPVSGVPILVLIAGTFTWGKAFSLVGVSVANLPLYVTEMALAAALLLLVLEKKSPLQLWKEWQLPIPRDLVWVLAVYFLLGILYIVIGVIGNGALALRDIVFCLYLLFMFITLSLLGKPDRIKNLLSMMKLPVIFLLSTAFLIFFIYLPDSMFKSFVREIKMTNLGLYCGLVVMYGMSFYAYIKKGSATPAQEGPSDHLSALLSERRGFPQFPRYRGTDCFFNKFFQAINKRGSATPVQEGKLFQTINKIKAVFLVGFSIYLGFLFVVMAEVRAAWAGLFVALVLLGILLKKEFKIFIFIFVLVVVSFLIIDYYDLGVQKGKLTSIAMQLESMTHRWHQVTMPSANIKWRLDLWKQTLAEIKEHPVFGWGYGIQIDYIVWTKPLSWLKAIGADTGILPPHNHLLAVTYKMGLVGLVLFLFINIRVFFYGLLYIKKCKSEFNRRFLIAGLVGLIYWHGMAFFFDVLESPPTGIFLWVLVGSILAIVHVDRG